MKKWGKLKKTLVISAVGIFGLAGLGSLGSFTEHQINNPTVSPSPTAVQGAQTSQQPTEEPAATPTVTPAQTPAAVPVVTPEPLNCPNGTYVNSDGITVCSPYSAPSTPSDATAKCLDGTYSFSLHRSGTCSHHGGVAEWL